MTSHVLTFFNNKSGVGKTSLVYHVAWMFSELDRQVLAVDLDPQANLTVAFLDEDELAELWIPDLLDSPSASEGDTIFRCLEPLTKVGDLREPRLRPISDRLSLLPGDLALSGFEDLLSTEWPNCLGNQNLYRAFRVITAFWQVIQAAADQCAADIVLVDVGPSLGAINRSALIATDSVVVPLGSDLFSLQGLRNLGPTLRRWRSDWSKRRQDWQPPEFELPYGAMQPIGYVVPQHGVRLTSPIAADDRWIRRIPEEYARSVLGEASASKASPDTDPHRIATLKHYRSLIQLGQDARKPIFHLTPADGALGSHSVAARDAFTDFKTLALEIQRRMEASTEGGLP